MLTPLQARAVTAPVFCLSAATTAQPVCDRIAAMVAESGWLDKRPGATMGVEVLGNTASHLRIALTLTAADGRSHRIDRALSASDTTITTAMQDRFLRNVLAALPSDF